MNQTSRHSRNFSHTLSTKARSCTEVGRIHRRDASYHLPEIKTLRLGGNLSRGSARFQRAGSGFQPGPEGGHAPKDFHSQAPAACARLEAGHGTLEACATPLQSFCLLLSSLYFGKMESLARPGAILGQPLLAMRGRLRRSMLSHGFMLGDVGFLGAPVDRMGRGPALLLQPSALVLPAIGFFARQSGLCTAPVGSRLGAEDIRLRPESLWLGQSGSCLGEKGICLGHKYPFLGDKRMNNRDLRFSASFCPHSRRPRAKSPIRPSFFP